MNPGVVRDIAAASAPEPASLAVVVVNWRDELQTLDCVAAVQAWSRLTPRLIVVDNEATPSSSEALRSRLAPADLISSPANLGYAGGNNRGIEQALAGGCDYVLLLNPDASIAEAAVLELLAKLRDDPAISIIGPVLHERGDGVVRHIAGGRDIASHLMTRCLTDIEGLDALPGHPLRPVEHIPGAVFLARGSVFESTGLLDERYFFSGEIADFCKRARDRGHLVYVALDVHAAHDTALTPRARRESLYTYYTIRNRFLYVQKHHAEAKARYVARWTAISAREFARALKDRKPAKARAIWLALLDGYRHRFSNRNAHFSGSSAKGPQAGRHGQG